jgi:hypothetical protein
VSPEDGTAAFWDIVLSTAGLFIFIGLIVIVGAYAYDRRRPAEGEDDVVEFPIMDLTSDDGRDKTPEKESRFIATSAEVQQSPWTYVQRAMDGETTMVVRSDTGEALCFITPHKESLS